MLPCSISRFARVLVLGLPWLLGSMAGGEEPIIDAKNWKITLPLPNSIGEALEITHPRFARFLADPSAIPGEHGEFFRVEDEGLVLRCVAGGATTVNTDYPRTELRQMNPESPGEELEWTLSEGGTLEFRFRIGPREGEAQKLIFAQIHGHEPESKPLLKCLWEKGHLRLLTKSGEALEDHAERHRYLPLEEGQWYDCRIVAGAEGVSVAIDGMVVETFSEEHLRWWPEKNTFYFKVGNYLQEKGEGRGATVTLSRIKVHSGAPSIDPTFFREALREIPPRFLADIPLAKRKRFLDLAAKSSSRWDAKKDWLHWYSDGARTGATSMIWAKALPRPNRSPLVFIHLAKPYADGKKPRLDQTFLLEKREEGWVEVTKRVMPEGVDLSLHFRTRRDDTIIEVANWKEIERADGRGKAWVFGDRVNDLHWSGERFVLEPAASSKLTRN